MEHITNSPLETESFAAALGKRLKPGTVIAFSGDLGAGKTCFTRGLCDGLGFRGEVSSPTFAIVNVYEGGTLPIYHFDMYRICGWEDLETTGYFDYTEKGDGITVVEWSENILAALPDDALYICIEKLGVSKRKIVLNGGGF